MSLRIERFAERHVSAAAELERQCFSAPWSEDALREELDNEHALFLAAVDDQSGETLGYIGCHVILDEGYIANVAVPQGARRMGVGSALVQALLEAAAQRGAAFVTLEVRVSNAPAIGLYRKWGFAPVGTRKGFYDKPKEDALLMTVDLTQKKGTQQE